MTEVVVFFLVFVAASAHWWHIMLPGELRCIYQEGKKKKMTFFFTLSFASHVSCLPCIVVENAGMHSHGHTECILMDTQLAYPC